jgi:alpha-ketoglutarate-dependent taurine dioxygenase
MLRVNHQSETTTAPVPCVRSAALYTKEDSEIQCMSYRISASEPRMTTSEIELKQKLHQHFGAAAMTTPLTSPERMGRRIEGIDLSQTLNVDQAQLIVDLLDHFQIICFPNQDQAGFSLLDLERLANHFGAPIPHPKNYANYADFKKHKAPLVLPPREQQTAALCDQAFPGQLSCIDDANSPAVYIVTNLVGSGPDVEEETIGGLHWHTDIEFEPTPLSTSMFYVQAVPTTRESSEGTWVAHQTREAGFYHPKSAPELMERRNVLPLNGETAYADTAAAYADLSQGIRDQLDGFMVRRKLRIGDPGWLIPLVYSNPRTGTQSLHSPVWASRGKNIAPVEIDGWSVEETRLFLDNLEAHVLKPDYRYDHPHHPGDVTLWSNFSTLHNAPPAKRLINRPEDARLMYRISCKGEPSFDLPRSDNDQWLNSNILPPYRSPEHIFERHRSRSP